MCSVKITRFIAALCATLVCGVIGAAEQSASDYSVKAFGAAGDGKALDTPAINKAIDAASAAGGGTVHFPAGTYLSVSIHLKSNVTLDLAPGATIVAASPAEGIHYDPPEPNQWESFQDFGHGHWHNALIWGENLENVAITGRGTIDGKGLVRGHKRQDDEGDKAIALKLCKKVTIKEVTITHGGHMAVLATGVDDLTIDNVTVDTNRDGFDIDCCRNVRVSNCTVNAPMDDGICLKSSYALGEARATENVTIDNCKLSGFDEGSFLDGTKKRSGGPTRRRPNGRIKFGTESNGGLKNLTVSNCAVEYAAGIALESVDGAIIEGVAVSNITMKDIVNAPIFLRLGARLRGPAGSTRIGQFRRVSVSKLTASNVDARTGGVISGIPGHPIEEVKLSGISIRYRGGGTKEEAATQPAEMERGYPEPAMFGQIPAYGFFIRHVNGIEMSDIELSWMKDDVRAPIALEDVTRATCEHLRAKRAADAPVFLLQSVAKLQVIHCDPLPDAVLESVERDWLPSTRPAAATTPSTRPAS